MTAAPKPEWVACPVCEDEIIECDHCHNEGAVCSECGHPPGVCRCEHEPGMEDET